MDIYLVYSLMLRSGIRSRCMFYSDFRKMTSESWRLDTKLMMRNDNAYDCIQTT